MWDGVVVWDGVVQVPDDKFINDQKGTEGSQLVDTIDCEFQLVQLPQLLLITQVSEPTD